MVDALSFELCLERLSSFSNCPHVLRPAVALLHAECASLQPNPKQVESLGTGVDFYLIAQGLLSITGPDSQWSSLIPYIVKNSAFPIAATRNAFHNGRHSRSTPPPAP